MRIYAIRDRLIDYFMRPFFLENDKAAMQAIAEIVNTEDSPSAITKAPHQFELWRLGEISEEGRVTEAREYLGDASGLIRAGIRTNSHRQSGDREAQIAPGRQGSTPSGDRDATGTLPSPPTHKVPATPMEAQEGNPGFEGGHRPRSMAHK